MIDPNQSAVPSGQPNMSPTSIGTPRATQMSPGGNILSRLTSNMRPGAGPNPVPWWQRGGYNPTMQSTGPQLPRAAMPPTAAPPMMGLGPSMPAAGPIGSQSTQGVGSGLNDTIGTPIGTTTGPATGTLGSSPSPATGTPPNAQLFQQLMQRLQAQNAAPSSINSAPIGATGLPQQLLGR